MACGSSYKKKGSKNSTSKRKGSLNKKMSKSTKKKK